MTLERFLAQRTRSWSELEALVDRSHGRADRLTPQEMRQLGLLYRKAAADLSVARRRYPGSPGTGRLETLVSAAHGLVYGKPRREDRISTFFTRRFWTRVREGGRCLALSIFILVTGTVLGFVWSIVDPVTASGILPAGFHATTHPGQGGVLGIAIPARTGLAFQIFTNNIEVSVLALAGGFTLGLLTAYVLASNGVMLGVLAGLEWKVGAWDAFTRLIVPHGLLELSCIAVAGSAGFQITRALIDPGLATRSASLRSIAPRLADTVLGVATCLVVAGLTEGIVTTWDLPIAAALAVGLFWGGGFWTLVIWRGRPPPDPFVGSPVVNPPTAALASST
jgi:uncharacterized membrane protein SpoIIM required for sporulation